MHKNKFLILAYFSGVAL